MSRIIIGNTANPLLDISGADLRQVSGNMSVDVIGDALAIDRLTAVPHYTFIAPEIYKPADAGCIVTTDGKIYCGYFEGFNMAERIPYGTPIIYENGGNYWGTFYLTGNIERMTGHRWKIPAVSLIGLYDKAEHLGGIYNGETFAELIAEIFDGNVGVTVAGMVSVSGAIEGCRVAEDLAAVKMYGWLPADTKRKNLHQALLATGGSMTRDSDGTIVFKYLKDLTEEEIEAARLFVGGSVRYSAEATGIELIEHTFQFAYNTEYQTVYDNTNAYAPPAEREKVIFHNPINHTTVKTEGNISIHEIGHNYAIVSGKGTVEAIPYVHLTRTLRKVKESSLPAEIKKLNNAYLVSPMNSENVLERAFNFYTQARTVKGNAEIKSEKVGKKYVFTNAFYEKVRGILHKAELNQSSFVHGNLEFVTDYTPGPFGNNYNEVMLFTGSGSGTVPTWLRQSKFPYIRVTLVGAGNGGEGGHGGQQGRGMWSTTGSQVTGRGSGPGGKGGKGGVAGEGGRILTVSRLDLSGIATIRYSCGTGGSAGRGGTGGKGADSASVLLPGAGGTGGDTIIELINDAGAVVATYTTANGAVLPSGVANLATSEVYGLRGKDGQRAGNGGEGGTASASADGGEGESITVDGVTWAGGKGSNAAYAQQSTQFGTMVAECGGGGGSGAAYGTPGKDSHQAAIAAWKIASEGGHGGHGVMAAYTPQAATTYGQGGDGGHGGSGGGSGGAQNNVPVQDGIQDGWPGNGANGTVGAAGAPGCVFFYIRQEESA